MLILVTIFLFYPKKFHNKPELDGIEKKMRVPICLTCGSAETCEHTEGENRDNKIQQQMDEESDDDGDKISKPRKFLHLKKLFFVMAEYLF